MKNNYEDIANNISEKNALESQKNRIYYFGKKEETRLIKINMAENEDYKKKKIIIITRRDFSRIVNGETDPVYIILDNNYFPFLNPQK